MIHLVVVVEGHSEEAFVKQILQPHLADFGVHCFASRVEFSRHRGQVHRGGLVDWDRADADVRRWLKARAKGDWRFTTMFDLYGLPQDSPGRTDARRQIDPYRKAHLLETAIGESIGDCRFLPYIQLHEFESLVLADARRLAEFYPLCREQAEDLAAMVSEHPTPEHINEGPETAPSKQIIKRIPDYRGGKKAVAPFVLERIGLANLRQACPHFGKWLTCLESLDSTEPEPWPVLLSME